MTTFRVAVDIEAATEQQAKDDLYNMSQASSNKTVQVYSIEKIID